MRGLSSALATLVLDRGTWVATKVRPADQHKFNKSTTPAGERIYSTTQSGEWFEAVESYVAARPDYAPQMRVMGINVFVDATGSPHEKGSACPIVVTFDLFNMGTRSSSQVMCVLGYLPKFGKSPLPMSRCRYR